MSKDEWYEKLREWAREDARLGKLPFALMTPLAEHLANYEAVEQSVHLTGLRRCPACKALLEETSVYCDNCGTDTPRK